MYEIVARVGFHFSSDKILVFVLVFIHNKKILNVIHIKSGITNNFTIQF